MHEWTDLGVSLLAVFWMEFLLPGGWHSALPAAWDRLAEEHRKMWQGKG